MATGACAENPPAGLRPHGDAATWLVICALVAGIAVIDPWGFAPFGPAKVTVIVAGVLASAAALGGRVIVLHRGLVRCWLGLLGWLGLAAAWAPDPLHAWLGTPDRRLGWLSWALLFAAWCCGRAVDGPRDLRRLLRAGAVAAGILGIYAVAEVTGLMPVAHAFADGRLGGPFGQPAYLGAAGALLTPIAVGLAADPREVQGWRLAAGAAAALGGLSVIGSQTRAAWVGLLLACVPLAPMAWRGARRRPAVAALVLGALAAVLVVTPVGVRVASLAGRDGTAQARVDEWRTAVAALSDAPLLGYGPEGYRIAFPRTVDAAYARAHGREVIPDRAHNGVLDVAVAGGLPAAMAYALALALVAAPAWQVARGSDPMTAGLGVGLLAYVVGQQFLFPVVEVDAIFWVLAGAVGSARASTSPLTLRVPITLGAGLAVAAAGMVLVGGLDVAADRSLQRAASAGPAGRTVALADADRAVALRPDSIRARYVAGRIAARGPAITDLDAGLDRIESGLALAPLDPALRTEHSRLLVERARRSGLPVDRHRARALLEVLVAEDPVHPGHRRRLAAVLVLAGELAAADTQLAAAEHLAPRSAAPSIERARLALRRDDQSEADAAAARAHDREPDHPELPGLRNAIAPP